MRTPAANTVRMHKRVRAAGHGVNITYKRGGVSIDLTVLVGRTAFASNVRDGARVEWGERDYLILVSELTGLSAAGGTDEPQEGDRIVETIDGTALTFELATPTGEPAVRHSDPSRQVWRVHCQRVVHP